MTFDIQNIPPHTLVTGRVESWIKDPSKRLPVSCTRYVVQDSMEEPGGIEDSWRFASYGLRNAQGVAIDISKLRAAGTANQTGLVSSGPSSFALCYSLFNQILRRGGTYKNGAINIHLDAEHPDVVDFMLLTREDLPWAFKTLDVRPDFVDYLEKLVVNKTVKRKTQITDSKGNQKIIIKNVFYENALQILIDELKSGDIFLSKYIIDKDGEELGSNVCVTDTTWVETSKGPKQVKDLIGVPFITIVNNKEYSSSSPLLDGKPSNLVGFYPTGYKPVYTLKTLQGWEIEVTDNHKVMTDNGLVEASNLKSGDKIKLNSLQGYTWTGGVGNHDQGWLLGQLIGDSCFATDKSATLYFYNEKQDLISNALDKLNNENITFTTRHEIEVNDGGSRTTTNSSDLATLAQTFNVTKVNKKEVNELFESGSIEFYKGFIQGLFDADACVTGSTKTRLSIQITQVSLKTLQTVQRMLLRLGIVSKIHKANQKAGLRSLPNSNRESTLYACQESHRLDITGQTNLKVFQEQIDFSFDAKKEKLAEALNSYSKKDYKLSSYVTFESLDFKEITHVYDCTIKDIHLFPANGLLVSNCLEVYKKSQGTCLLIHDNLGSHTPEEFPSIFKAQMKYICELHAITKVDEGGQYLSPLIDRQVGLGVAGAANMLAHAGITYADFTNALEVITGINTDKTNRRYSDKAFEVASYIYKGYQEAAIVAREYNMVRAFCVAPTASCSYRYVDRFGYTVTPEIAPPMYKIVERDSGTFGNEMYIYPENVETASIVGYDTFFKFNNAWQKMMNDTGLAHAISTNWWSDQVEMNKKLLIRWAKSYHRALYYGLSVNPTNLDKSKVLLDDEQLETQECNLNEKEKCIPCGE